MRIACFIMAELGTPGTAHLVSDAPGEFSSTLLQVVRERHSGLKNQTAIRWRRAGGAEWMGPARDDIGPWTLCLECLVEVL